MSKLTPRQHLITKQEISEMPEWPISHPLNPQSELYFRPLGDRIGLARVKIAMGRIPPGKESFIFHAHTSDEEFLYILSGRGKALIGDETFEVGPGDFMAFPTPSIGHHLTNPYDEDLVYLMAGEHGRVELTEFPKAGKHGIFTADGAIYFVDSAALKRVGPEDYIKK